MAGEKVLVFDSDSRDSSAACASLRSAGLAAVAAASIGEVLREIAVAPPGLLVVDWNLPGAAGLELIDGLRRRRVDPDLRVLIISALATETDIVTALDIGADDYLTKPYSHRELVARCNALLRGRRVLAATDRLEVGSLTLDCADRRAYVGERCLALQGAQLKLLAYFMAHRDRALSREQLLDPVWGHAAGVNERTVDVNVRRLRQALARVGLDHYLQTIRGIGYRLSAQC